MLSIHNEERKKIVQANLYQSRGLLFDPVCETVMIMNKAKQGNDMAEGKLGRRDQRQSHVRVEGSKFMSRKLSLAKTFR